MTVLLFARLRDLVGHPAVECDATSVADLRAELAARHPDAAPLLAACRVAVNHEFVADSHPLGPGDEVAVIPPVSGG